MDRLANWSIKFQKETRRLNDILHGNWFVVASDCSIHPEPLMVMFQCSKIAIVTQTSDNDTVTYVPCVNAHGVFTLKPAATLVCPLDVKVDAKYMLV